MTTPFATIPAQERWSLPRRVPFLHKTADSIHACIGEFTYIRDMRPRFFQPMTEGEWQILHIGLVFTIRRRYVWVCVANYVYVCCLNCPFACWTAVSTSNSNLIHKKCLCLQPFFCVLYPDFMTKTSVCVINATAVLCAVQLSRLTRICYSSWFFGKRQFFHSARLFTLTMFWDLCLKCLVLWFVHVFLIVETMFKDFCLNCAGFPSMPIRITRGPLFWLRR